MKQLDSKYIIFLEPLLNIQIMKKRYKEFKFLYQIKFKLENKLFTAHQTLYPFLQKDYYLHP